MSQTLHDSPAQATDERHTGLSDRLIRVHAAIEANIARVQTQIAGHYTWRDRLDEERRDLTDIEDKTTQNEIIAVVENRIRRFEHQIQTGRHDLALLRQHATQALERPSANTGSLARLVEKYEDGPDYDPTLIPRLNGSEALPYFMRPGATSGIARQAVPTRFEVFAYRGKTLLKAAAVLAVLYVVANGLDGATSGSGPGGAKFASPGAGTGFGNSGTGAITNLLGDPAQALSSLLATASGTDVSKVAGDTATTLESMGRSPALQ